MSSRRIRKFEAGGLLKYSPAAMLIDKMGGGKITDALNSPMGLLSVSPAMMALKAGEKSKKKKDGLS
jgi:hypothetical protein